MVNKIKCVFCNKSIRKFKVRTDWGKRKAHLTCWKEDSDWGYLKKYRYWKDRPENKIINDFDSKCLYPNIAQI